jgi:signal transduction histidine kinase
MTGEKKQVQLLDNIRTALRLFVLCATVSTCAALVLDASGCLQRLELQSINRMFEARQWIKWNPNSLHKLKPGNLWRYHEAHEIPRRIWAWDYTLSWAIADNHPPVKNKIVIFNHMLEDEPPPEAVASHPWMKPLLSYPTPRATIAQTLGTLAASGAKLVILDNDFPQYAPDDAELAKAIHESPIPVLMASTVNRRTFAGGMQLNAMTLPVGVLSELQKLEPTVDVRKKYTGLTTILMDEDQVVRRLFTRINDPSGESQSIVLKALNALGTAPTGVPELMDIDFASQPNSELYPVRPFSYLLDPEKIQQLGNPKSSDVNVNGAIVILGDSVQDVYATPLTNVGANLMSGAEILAHSIDTLSRESWLHRIDGAQRILYMTLMCIACAAIFTTTRFMRGSKWSPSKRVAYDWLGCIALSAITYGAGLLWFAFGGLVVPMVVPALAVAGGTLAGVLFERERERLHAMLTRLKAMEATLKAEREMHESEMRLAEAQAQAKEIEIDQQRRSEFVRRLNHDLKAPVTVLNWTLAKLKREGLNAITAMERLDHIERTSDRLIAELVRTYEKTDGAKVQPTGESDLRSILNEGIRMHESFAEMRGSLITYDLPDYPMSVTSDALEISRVMDNLIRNALTHNPSGTTVEVSARKRAHVHQIEVTDNGRGIKEADIEKIFDPGFSTSSGDGRGLGLSIVKTLVEKAGGTIAVESEEDLGTKFTITLPVATGLQSVIDPTVLKANQTVSTPRG